MKDTITKIKIFIDRIKSRMEGMGERICKLEDRTTEMT